MKYCVFLKKNQFYRLLTQQILSSVAGYDVPKGTLVFPNHSTVHFDPDHFQDPHAFKPERFIENGVVIRPKAFMPFGAGRRVCAGETAARYTLFLIFVHLVQNYRIAPPSGKKMKYECDKNLGAPLPFEVVMEKR